MLLHSLPLVLVACGSPVYIPTEPPPVGSLDSADTALDTGAFLTPLDIPCSGYGATAVTLEVINGSSAAVGLYWVDFACGEVLYGQIPAGASYLQSTFDTHVWLIRDDLGRYVDHVVLGATANQTLEIR